MNQTTDTESWDLIIQPKRAWWDLRLNEVWSYRDLVFLFVRRDFVSYYKQTILGPLWFLIQPLLTTLIFTVVFGQIASLPTDDLPPFLFYMAGTVIWSYFAECLRATSDTFITNQKIFDKVYFPRLAVPVSILFSNLITFSIQFGFFLVFMGFFALTISPSSTACRNAGLRMLWICFTVCGDNPLITIFSVPFSSFTFFFFPLFSSFL